MISPVDPNILNGNPKFDALYQDLCKNKLNPTGTSKIHDAKALKERETLADDLRKARVEAARRELIVSGLKELSYDANALPEDLRELVAEIAAVLEGHVAEEDRDLLQDDIASFKANVEPIAIALSQRLDQDVATLATLVDPDNQTSSLDLASTVSTLKTALRTSESLLDNRSLQHATETTKVHNLQRAATRQCIAILEQAIHGSVARGSKAKSEYLAIVAEGMSKKLSLQERHLQSQLYSPEAQSALTAKEQEIEEEFKVTRRKVREAEEKLEGYRSARGMEGVAREYGEVLAEQERVRAEIERLEGGGGKSR